MHKNNYYFICIVFSFLFLLSSCKIQGSFQGLYSYYNKVKKENPDLIIENTSYICELKQEVKPKVFVITGTQLKKCIEENQQQDYLVYIWKPKCRGQFCYSLDLLQRTCNVKNINLYIVAEYYDGILMLENYHIQNPIFGIDVKYYKTRLTSKYLSRFLYDLTGKADIEESLLLFQNGKFQKSFYDIDEL